MEPMDISSDSPNPVALFAKSSHQIRSRGYNKQFAKSDDETPVRQNPYGEWVKLEKQLHYAGYGAAFIIAVLGNGYQRYLRQEFKCISGLLRKYRVRPHKYLWRRKFVTMNTERLFNKKRSELSPEDLKKMLYLLPRHRKYIIKRYLSYIEDIKGKTKITPEHKLVKKILKKHKKHKAYFNQSGGIIIYVSPTHKVYTYLHLSFADNYYLDYDLHDKYDRQSWQYIIPHKNFTKAKRVFVGRYADIDEIMRNPDKDSYGDGNTLLLQMSKNKYLLVEDEICTKFDIKDTIRYYASPIHRNASYPYAVGDKNIYYFWRMEYVPISYLKKNNIKLEGNLAFTELPKNIFTTFKPERTYETGLVNNTGNIETSRENKKRENDRKYYPFYNGDKPFEVCISPKKPHTVTVYRRPNDNDEYTLLVKQFKARRVLVSQYDLDDKSVANSGERCVLVEVKKHKYVQISGDNVCAFTIKDNIKTYLVSGVNGDILYPFAIGSKNVYFLLDFKYVPITYLKKNKIPLTESLYDVFYETLEKHSTPMKGVKKIADSRYIT
jgi:hypothetical protein